MNKKLRLIGFLVFSCSVFCYDCTTLLSCPPDPTTFIDFREDVGQYPKKGTFSEQDYQLVQALCSARQKVLAGRLLSTRTQWWLRHFSALNVCAAYLFLGLAAAQVLSAFNGRDCNNDGLWHWWCGYGSSLTRSACLVGAAVVSYWAANYTDEILQDHEVCWQEMRSIEDFLNFLNPGCSE